MGQGDSLGDRMKGYEYATRTALPRRMPVILRADGKAFHTYTRGLARPFDAAFTHAMDRTAVALCEAIQGAQMAYVQSDEISVLIHSYKRHTSAAWFDNEVQKMTSVSASIAAATMTAASATVFGDLRVAYFDARVAVYPEADVCNYFIWRQQDAVRNSIQMTAQALYSPKQLHGKNCNELQDMIHAKGQNWNDVPTRHKRGRCIVRETYDIDGATRLRWVVDDAIPVFTDDRNYVERFLPVEPEDPMPVPRFVGTVSTAEGSAR